MDVAAMLLQKLKQNPSCGGKKATTMPRTCSVLHFTIPITTGWHLRVAYQRITAVRLSKNFNTKLFGDYQHTSGFSALVICLPTSLTSKPQGKLLLE